jgi:hypothetical protein
MLQARYLWKSLPPELRPEPERVGFIGVVDLPRTQSSSD